MYDEIMALLAGFVISKVTLKWKDDSIYKLAAKSVSYCYGLLFFSYYFMLGLCEKILKRETVLKFLYNEIPYSQLEIILFIIYACIIAIIVSTSFSEPKERKEGSKKEELEEVDSIIIKFVTKIVLFLIKIVKWILNILLFPLCWIINKIMLIVYFNKIAVFIKKSVNVVYKYHKVAYRAIYELFVIISASFTLFMFKEQLNNEILIINDFFARDENFVKIVEFGILISLAYILLGILSVAYESFKESKKKYKL